MSVRALIDALLVQSPINIRHIVEQYFGLLYLDKIECDVIYDSYCKCHKLRDLNTGKIGLLDTNKSSLDFRTQQYVLNPTMYECKMYECKFYEIEVIAENDYPIKFLTRSRLLAHVEFLKKNTKSYDFITWLNPGEKFSIIFNTRTKTKQILTAAEAICIFPGDELYKYFPSNLDSNYRVPKNNVEDGNDVNFVYYDKTKNIILGKDKKCFAILLSMGWEAPKWATNSLDNLFDVAKVLEILPEDKLPRRKLHYYETGNPMKNLCVRWVPVGKQFILYYSSDRGENFKLVEDFDFTV